MPRLTVCVAALLQGVRIALGGLAAQGAGEWLQSRTRRAPCCKGLSWLRGVEFAHGHRGCFVRCVQQHDLEHVLGLTAGKGQQPVMQQCNKLVSEQTRHTDAPHQPVNGQER